MSQWYFAKKGKSIGPHSQEEIVELLDQGQVGAMDLLFKIGENEWKPLSEWSEFSDADVVTQTKGRPEQWVVYIERGDEQKKIGPVDTTTVHEMLEDGSILPEDFIWKEGMSEWYEIKSIQEFRQEVTETAKIDNSEVLIAGEQQIYQESAADLLKNIKVKDSKQLEEISQTISIVSTEVEDKEDVIEVSNNSAFREEESEVTEFPSSPPIGEEAHSDDVSKAMGLSSGESLPGNDPGSGMDEAVKGTLKDEGLSKKKEIKKRRQELDVMMKKLFGEEVFELEANTQMSKKKGIEKTVKQMADQLPVTRILREKGFVDKEKSKKSDSTEPQDEKNNAATKSKIEKIIKETKLSDNVEKDSFFQKASREVSALFPKGTLLRLFAIFFLVFAFTIIIALSSLNDKERAGKQKKLVENEMNKGQQLETRKQAIKKQQKLVSQRKKAAEISKNRKIAPTKINLKMEGKFGSRFLIINTDASKHYSLVLTIQAGIKNVVGSGAYYYKVALPARKELKFSFNKLKIPKGRITVKSSVGARSARKVFRNFNNPIAFKNELIANKKKVSVWHQKEKRALYATANRMKDLGLQLFSLLPLRRESELRWKRAYRNWKKKVVANRSSYLKNIHPQAKNSYVYPVIWLDLKSLEKILLGVDMKNPIFDYTKFKYKINTSNDKIKALSLW